MAEEKEKKTQKKWEKYEVEGDTLKRKNKICPKCGPGVFLAEHNDRWACGACGYMEKKSSEPKQEKKENQE
jgi:small subunit ribosomal protein S27Ae